MARHEIILKRVPQEELDMFGTATCPIEPWRRTVRAGNGRSNAILAMR